MNNSAHVIHGFFEYCTGVKRLKKSSVKDIKCTLNKVIKFFAEEKIVEYLWEVELEVYIRYFQHLRLKGERGSGISKQLSQMRSFLDYCHRVGHSTRNVLVGFSLADKSTKYIPRCLTIDEITALLKTTSRSSRLNRKKRLIILILYGLGLRTSELTNIKIKNIDIERQELFVKGKFDIERKIPIPDGVWVELLSYLHEMNLKRGLLFRTDIKKTKLSISEVGDVVKSLIKEAGIEPGVTPRTLRHTFASHLMDQGVDIAVISSLMGHKSPRETGVYLHAFENRKEEAIAKVEPLLEEEE